MAAIAPAPTKPVNASSPGYKLPPFVEDVIPQTDDIPGTIHQKLGKLHSKETQNLARDTTVKHTIEAQTQFSHGFFHTSKTYIKRCFLDTGRYLRYLYQTWTAMFLATISGSLTFTDWFSWMFFAVGGTILLGIMLPVCLALNFPTLNRFYFWWSSKQGGNLGLVNSMNPNIFNAMTPEQAEAGKAALSEEPDKNTDTEKYRQFNYDRAKILLQIASVIYEHENDAILKAISLSRQIDIQNTLAAKTLMAAGTKAIDFGGKGLNYAKGTVGQYGKGALDFGKGALASGKDIVGKYDGGALAQGTEAFNDYSKSTLDAIGTLDIQKRLSLVENEQRKNQNIAVAEEYEKAAAIGDARIREWCRDYGLDYEPISELNNVASAFSGLFWDPHSNWICVAFKGTAPIEYAEWLSDFNARMVPIGDEIDGFRLVHAGFRDRIFPQYSDKPAPWETIQIGIKTLAKHLRQSNNFPEDKLINVWFTGHSLGCATASLVYSKYVMNDLSLGIRTAMRDAYLFAAPILCDRGSVDRFNEKMLSGATGIKTLWRITSNGDAVATMLPDLGDRRATPVSDHNGFAFSHLGTELDIHDHPKPSRLSGWHIKFQTPTEIKSHFSWSQIQEQRKAHYARWKDQNREWQMNMMQKIPLMGRLAAHATVAYWDQLNRITLDKPGAWVRLD